MYSPLFEESEKICQDHSPTSMLHTGRMREGV